MARAAAPNYLAKADQRQATPELRFGLLLPIWQENWQKDIDTSNNAWKEIARLEQNDKQRGKAFLERQRSLPACLPPESSLVIEAQSIAPFTTGLGNEHPLENGFAFLNPYGLPYLPGSGVKGVVRRAAEELAGIVPGIDWEEECDWNKDAVTTLFGPGSDSGDNLTRGALSFWDVMPQIKEDKLMIEIMTPHYSHYYQPECDKGEGSTSPHDSGMPNPIRFLTVPPGSKFTFHVVCDINRLKQLEPNLAKDDRWKKLLESVFKHAFDWCGFGAKTAVGYGAMKTDPCIEEAARRKAEEKAAHQAQQEEERQQREAKEAEATRRQAEQAEFDALPESRKRIIQVDRALHAFQEGSRFDESRSNELKGQANRLSKEACAWSDAAAREEAAALLERLYDTIGWHDPGVKQDKRTKQEKKKRDAIACIREN